MSEPALSIVIATRDRAALLGCVLDSLALQASAPPFEAVVVDNGSVDGTAELLRAREAAGAYPLRAVHVTQPNRGAARNAGLAIARGRIVVFVDDDTALPPGFLAAHAAAHAAPGDRAVSGPILNVAAADSPASPTWANYSRAFFCTCNVSVPRAALERAGGFDERFRLYGWEDTELGLRLRAAGVKASFAWGAWLRHIKPPHEETLDVAHRKTVERAAMAAHLLRVADGWRARLATGAYLPNLVRSTLVAPRASLGLYRRLATAPRVPAPLRAVARAQYLDGTYVTTLRDTLRELR